jgi:hypothetical protein
MTFLGNVPAASISVSPLGGAGGSQQTVSFYIVYHRFRA